MRRDPLGGSKKQIPVAQTFLSLFIWRKTAFSQEPTSQTLFQIPIFAQRTLQMAKRTLELVWGVVQECPYEITSKSEA